MIISIINLKGGVGKTTTAIALASIASEEGRDMRVYDTDPQSSASLWALTAEEHGDPLPFDVTSANIATVRSAKKVYGGDRDKWVIIDCPPNGHVMDEAMKVADMVVIPTTTGPADIGKAFETAETLSEREIYYAILLTRVVANTLTLKQSVSELDEREESYFDTFIPNREGLKNVFGNTLGKELYGYDGVWNEIKEALDAD